VAPDPNIRGEEFFLSPKDSPPSLPLLLGMSSPPSAEKHFEDTKSSGGEKVDIIDEKVLEGQSINDSDDESVRYVNGEPVITTGKDVSRFAVDLRDDGGDALTFRSIFLGTIFAGLGAALCQVCVFHCLAPE
jgi:hypothetical protein